jgi:hypothetical protein
MLYVAHRDATAVIDRMRPVGRYGDSDPMRQGRRYPCLGVCMVPYGKDSRRYLRPNKVVAGDQDIGWRRAAGQELQYVGDEDGCDWF